jgi:lipoprotein-anchoring transpeptidase ErfK/SrfK
MRSAPAPDHLVGPSATAGASRHIGWPLRLGIVLAGAVLVAGGSVLVLSSSASTPSGVSAPPGSASEQPSADAAPTGSGAPQYPAYAAVARTASVPVLDAPDGTRITELRNPLPSGAPLTFLLQARLPGWVQVQLPTRPNGGVGWVHASDVSLRGLHYALDVEQSTHQLTLLRDSQPLRSFPAATGTGRTPTPNGEFYLKELLQPTNTGYGPYAYGLSGHSTVLNSFDGGDGEIGLHGTSDTTSIGRSTSHGCIRLRNTDITFLAHLLPLGTPITIHT